ncbi:MAG: T9SS type A sorting domain-containing protein [Sphingobacteriales bacterium]|nr:MAG: T9SS type A sorting domain-containing protein [Sphingobacteriales bacterium]
MKSETLLKMKRALYGAFSSLLLFSSLAQAQWTPVGGAGISPGGLSNWQHLEISDDDTLYVSFNDEGLTGGQGTVMKYNGTSWVSVGTPGFTPGISHHSNFCLGPADTVYYSFADGNNMSKAAVMMFNGTTWSSMGTGISGGECQYSNIKVNSAGVPHLVYIDNGSNSGSLYAKKWNGTAWVDMTSAAGPVAWGSCSYATAAFGPNDTLYVACKEGTGMVTVKKFDGSNWVNVGTSFLSMPFGSAYDVYLKFNHAGVPYVTYWNPAPMGPKASVQRFNGVSWVDVGLPSFNSGIAQFTSIDFDPNDTIYVAYTDATTGMAPEVMKFNGTTWVPVGSFTPGAQAAHLSLALDGIGNPYVAFYDNVSAGKTTVMKYGLCAAPVITDLFPADSVICKGDTMTLTVTGSLNDATTWYWYTGSCNGTLADSGTTITIHPSDTITYYVRGGGGCVVSGPCVAVNVFVPDVVAPSITAAGALLTSSAGTGNQWNLSGAPITGATGNTFTATVDGWYSVTVTSGSCSATSDSVFVVVSDVSDPSRGAYASVYPVPAQDLLHVDFAAGTANTRDWSLRLTDNTGRIIHAAQGLDQKNIIDMKHLAPGFYFITLSGEGKQQVLKINK